MSSSRIALVTGGSRGLGKNMALSLAEKGLDVIVTYNHNKFEAEDVVAQIQQVGQRAGAIQLDVSRLSGFEAFKADVLHTLSSTFGTDKFDYLINNAGIGIHKSFADTTEEEFNNLLAIHFQGPFFLTQMALTIMNDGGGIVNISTGLTRFSNPIYAAYASMKGAIETLTIYLAKELGERKIRVNAVAPGAVETDFAGGVVRDNEQINAFIASTTALGRAGRPDDIGGVVAFLCSDEARWVNAQRIEVSGGQAI